MNDGNTAQPTRRRYHRIFAILAAAVVAAGIVVATTVPAHAASACDQTAYVLGTGSYVSELPAQAQTSAGLQCSLVAGNTGSAVKRLQQNLNDCYKTYLQNGYHSGSTTYAASGVLSVDGQFGNLTKQALKIAQAVEGASPDGNYGDQSRTLLKWDHLPVEYGDYSTGQIVEDLTCHRLPQVEAIDYDLDPPSSVTLPTCTQQAKVMGGSGYLTMIPAASQTTAGLDCVLRQGASGDVVKLLQADLNRCYGYSLLVDGQFGANTLAALEYAQREAGILPPPSPSSGDYGFLNKTTRNRIRWTDLTNQVCAAFIVSPTIYSTPYKPLVKGDDVSPTVIFVHDSHLFGDSDVEPPELHDEHPNEDVAPPGTSALLGPGLRRSGVTRLDETDEPEGSYLPNCQDYWQPMKDAFIARGFAADHLRTFGYYGSMDCYYRYNSPMEEHNNVHGGVCGPATSNDSPALWDAQDDTRLEDIAECLAWVIYNNYSSQDRDGDGHYDKVDLVGHGVGGSIIRDALWEIEKHNPAFPPYLYVENVVTLGTPYLGWQGGEACWVEQAPVFCEQTSKNPLSSDDEETYQLVGTFLMDENNDPRSWQPQSDMTTDWTAIASMSDAAMGNTVGWTSALGQGDPHEVIFACTGPCNPRTDPVSIAVGDHGWLKDADAGSYNQYLCSFGDCVNQGGSILGDRPELDAAGAARSTEL